MKIDDETAWQAIIDNDAGYDGQFVYGVQSTGIYCKPSCPSRNPLKGNVLYFASHVIAEQHGFRGCKRCNPSG